MEETRITLVDEDNDSYEIQVASNQTIIRNHDPLVGVAFSEGLRDMLGDTRVASMYGWHAVVTDGDTGTTYSGTVTDVSQYGFLVRPDA